MADDPHELNVTKVFTDRARDRTKLDHSVSEANLIVEK
jgi:hypothetical protein